LRNKQSLKRSYLLSEKQFATIVKEKSQRYAKNNNVSHDNALFQFLESRLDVIVLRSGLANSIMQARQMVNHGHLQLNGIKHNIPSTFVKSGDMVVVREKLQASPLYSQAWSNQNLHAPSWIKIDKNKFAIEVLAQPIMGEIDA
jgi:small subunit ribosomal protein S4